MTPPEKSRILTPAECRARIEKMRAEGRLPSREQFEQALDQAVGKILLERLPLATKKIQ